MPIAYEALQAAIATSKNPKSMMKMYAGVRHGVEMFRDHPELPAVITSCLEEVLGKGQVTQKRPTRVGVMRGTITYVDDLLVGGGSMS